MLPHQPIESTFQNIGGENAGNGEKIEMRLFVEIYQYKHPMKMRLMLMIFLVQLSILSYSQFHIVKGKALDLNGNPIPYATIKSAKIREIITSNKEGAFSFQTPYKYDTLSCTHISFQTKTEVLSGNDTVNFYLLPNVTSTFIAINPALNNSSKIEDADLIKQWFAEREKQKESEDYFHAYYLHIEIPAKYKNGEMGFKNEFDRIYDSLSCPKFHGIIKIGLTLDKKGIFKNSKLITGISTPIDNAVMEVLKQMHSWQPAVQNGRNVSSYIEVIIEH